MKQNDISRNLSKWDSISRYSTWMYHIYENYVGQRIFDVGAGMGRMVRYYIDRAEVVLATDIFQHQVDYMNEAFKEYPAFKAMVVDIMQDDLKTYQGQFDTVICINVLEHLADDYKAVAKMKSLLMERGKLIIMVPAWQKLFCDMDRNVGHYRRYDPGRLEDIAAKNEMNIVKHHYFNCLGVIPYWLKGKRKVEKSGSFSTSMSSTDSRIYNLATRILEPLEKIYPPQKHGLTEVIIMEK